MQRWSKGVELFGVAEPGRDTCCWLRPSSVCQRAIADVDRLKRGFCTVHNYTRTRAAAQSTRPPASHLGPRAAVGVGAVRRRHHLRLLFRHVLNPVGIVDQMAARRDGAKGLPPAQRRGEALGCRWRGGGRAGNPRERTCLPQAPQCQNCRLHGRACTLRSQSSARRWCRPFHGSVPWVHVSEKMIASPAFAQTSVTAYRWSS